MQLLGDSLRGINRAVQIFEEISDSARRFYDYEEWGAPEGAQAQLIQGEATILLLGDVVLHSIEMRGRFVRSKDAPNHIYPGPAEAGKGRPYQFAAELRFASKRFEGYLSSSIGSKAVRVIPSSSEVTAWLAGDCRRESSGPELFVCLGDPFGMINVHSPS